MSVDGIAPGDMHGLGGRNSQGGEGKMEKQTELKKKLQLKRVAEKYL